MPAVRCPRHGASHPASRSVKVTLPTRLYGTTRPSIRRIAPPPEQSLIKPGWPRNSAVFKTVEQSSVTAENERAVIDASQGPRLQVSCNCERQRQITPNRFSLALLRPT